MRRQAIPDGALQALFAPRSIAIVGASDDPTKWGNILARRALSSGSGREVLLVNRSKPQVLAAPAFASVSAAAEVHGLRVDLAVLCVPADSFVEAVADSVAAGARAIVAITSGLAEVGAQGAALQSRALELVRDAGAVLVGPNCLGVVDHSSDLQLAHAALPPGDVAILSQSGNLVLDLAGLLRERGLGVSRFVSLGNQADIGVVELMRACVTHDQTRVVGVYAEDLIDGRGFIEAARALRRAGKPVLLIAPGRSDAARRGAASHTGSMTSASMVVDAACAASGVHRVESPAQMVDLIEALRMPRRMPGRRTAVLTDGGGHGAVAADVLASRGLETPLLTGETASALTEALSPRAIVTNPVDMAGAGERELGRFARAVEILLGSSEVDGVLLSGYFGGYSLDGSGLVETEVAAAQQIAETVGNQGKPLVVQTIFPESPAMDVLRAAGIPVHRDIERACAVLHGLQECDWNGLGGLLTDAGEPIRDAGYRDARTLFASAGVVFPRARFVTDEAGLDEALTGLRFPVVLKAVGRLHKSEGGGVVLDIPDADTARLEFRELLARLDPAESSVEEMIELPDAVEVIVGSVQDPTFGPVITVGLGGVFTEILGDAATAIAPVSVEGARRLLLSLRSASMLHGARGRRPVNIDALAELVAAVSALSAEHPEIAELELNPVLAGAGEVVALDARLVLR